MKGFLDSSIKLAEYYRSLGEKTMAQLTGEELNWSPGPSSNSIAVIIRHLWGNMLSRWTNFLDEDGEKPWRQRDAEFEESALTQEEVKSKWDEGWNCFLGTLRSLTEPDLVKTVYIRNEGQSVMDAIQRQLAHYPMHIGQMIYIGKILKGDDWQTLSIPKGGSGQYNTRKFAQEKQNKHFTDEV